MIASSYNYHEFDFGEFTRRSQEPARHVPHRRFPF